jgi:hypothetical protein
VPRDPLDGNPVVRVFGILTNSPAASRKVAAKVHLWYGLPAALLSLITVAKLSVSIASLVIGFSFGLTVSSKCRYWISLVTALVSRSTIGHKLLYIY